MNERPIIFKNRVVRAILGDSKTQTRRMMTVNRRVTIDATKYRARVTGSVDPALDFVTITFWLRVSLYGLPIDIKKGKKTAFGTDVAMPYVERWLADGELPSEEWKKQLLWDDDNWRNRLCSFQVFWY